VKGRETWISDPTCRASRFTAPQNDLDQFRTARHLACPVRVPAVAHPRPARDRAGIQQRRVAGSHTPDRGLAITLALAPALPPLPAIPAGSWLGLAVLAEQILIGVMLGFTLRITFAAVDIAGELIGLQMGLGFATFFDPGSGGQTPVMSANSSAC
jgi:hypothetical protein